MRVFTLTRSSRHSESIFNVLHNRVLVQIVFWIGSLGEGLHVLGNLFIHHFCLFCAVEGLVSEPELLTDRYVERRLLASR